MGTVNDIRKTVFPSLYLPFRWIMQECVSTCEQHIVYYLLQDFISKESERDDKSPLMVDGENSILNES